MQRVVYVHPVHWEELPFFQLAIAEHLMAEVTDFNIEHPITELALQCIEHIAEERAVRIALVLVAEDSFAQQSAVHI